MPPVSSLDNRAVFFDFGKFLLIFDPIHATLKAYPTMDHGKHGALIRFLFWIPLRYVIILTLRLIVFSQSKALRIRMHGSDEVVKFL
jgi:hypothetical protein